MTAEPRAKLRRHARIYNRTSHRLREIERIIKHRHGVVPDTDDADIILDQVACCYLQMLRKRTRRLPELIDLIDRLKLWCERWAPDISILLCRNVAQNALRWPRIDKADDCAARLRLSYDERTLLRITTIGACDVSKRERTKRRKARKLIRDRNRAAKKRAERGAIPRSEYERNSLSATQPWKAQGISRRTWERRRRATLRPQRNQVGVTFDASPSPTSTASMLGDTLASPVSSVEEGSGSIFLGYPLSSRHWRNQGAIVPRRGQRAAGARPRTHAGDQSAS